MSFIKTELKDGYAILTIERIEAMNALSEDVLSDLRKAMSELTANQKMRGLILTGSGEKAFCAGADINKMAAFSTVQAEAFARLGHESMNTIANANLISIAAINGVALGGGLELALSCDIRIASTNARMGLPETGLGIIPGFGGTQRLSRTVGAAAALEIILTGDFVPAGRAYEIGLVNRLCEPAELLSQAEAMMQKMLSKGPDAQRQARWLVHSGLDQPLTAGLEREIIGFSELFGGSEPSVGLTAFIEKKKPQF